MCIRDRNYKELNGDVMDAQRAQALLTDAYAQLLSLIHISFCVGTGTGQPTGIFTESGGEVGVTAGSATAISVDNLIELVYALKSPYRRNAKFLMNDATISLIRKLKDQNSAYLWQPSVQAGQPDRLLGCLLYTSRCV